MNIYIDTTGSMIEMGKNSAVLYISKSIQDYCSFKSIETFFYKLDNTKISNLPSIEFSNNTTIDIDNIKNNSIILSDGLFDNKDKEIFDIAISVGIDASLDNLKKMSKKVFTSDEILSALEFLIFHNNLQMEIGKDLKDDEDEW